MIPLHAIRSGILEAWARWNGACRGWRVDDPHAVRACGAEFGDGVCECADRCNVEDWVRVLAIVHAALRKNDGDEVYACVSEKRDRRAVREQLRMSRQRISLITEERTWFSSP